MSSACSSATLACSLRGLQAQRGGTKLEVACELTTVLLRLLLLLLKLLRPSCMERLRPRGRQASDWPALSGLRGQAGRS